MSSDSRPDTRPQKNAAAAASGSRPDRARRFFFGDDVFVSYARHDSDYALALADELTRRGLSCFLDQWGTPAGVELPSELVERLRKATMLVIVGTEWAARSENVMKEVVEFQRTKRPIIPITFVGEEDFAKIRNNEIPEGLSGTLEQARWYGEIAGIARTVESKARLKSTDPRTPVEPSAQVITRITNAEGFISRSKRLRKTFWATLASLALLLAAGGLVAWMLVEKANARVRKAQEAESVARGNARKADVTRAEAEKAKEQAVRDLADAKALTEQARKDLTAARENLKKASADLVAANEKTRREQARAERARLEAQRQGRLADSQALAARAVARMEVDPEESVLLAQKAYAAAPTEQAGSALRQSLLRSSVLAVFRSEDGAAGAPAFDETGEYVVSGDAGGAWYVRRAETGEIVKRLPPDAGRYPAPRFSPDGRYVYATSRDDREAAVQLWEWAADLSPSNPRALRGDVEPNAVAPPQCVLLTCSVSSPDFSADGKYLAAASRRGLVWVWDAATAERVGRLAAGETALSLLRFSPGEGKYLLFSESKYVSEKSGLTNDDDERLMLWEWRAAPGDSNPRTMRQPGHVADIAFDPTGRFIAAAVNREEREVNPDQPEGYREGTEDKTTPASYLVHVYEVETGARAVTLDGHIAAVWDVSFSPDGQYLLTASQDTTARVYDWRNQRMRRRPVILKHGDSVSDATFDRSGEYVVTSGGKSAARLWKPGLARDFAKNDRHSLDSPLVAVLRGHTGYAWARFSTDGKRILTESSEDKTARVWRADAGRVKAAMLREERQPGFSGAALSPDGGHMVTAEWGGEPLRVWRADGGGRAAVAELGSADGDGYRNPSFSPDGRLVVAATYTHVGGVQSEAVRAWEWQDETQRMRPRTIEEGTAHLTSLAVSQHEGGAAYVVTARRLRHDAPPGPEGPAHAARVWNLGAAEGAQPAAVIPHAQPVMAAAFSHDRASKYLATTGGDDVLIFAWAENSRPLHTLDSKRLGALGSLAFSPDGNYLAAAGTGGTALVWDLRTKAGHAAPTVLRTPTSSLGYALHFHSVAFSPDGKLILTAATDDTVRLWDSRTGESLRIIGEGKYASISRDGRYVFASSERAARLYECPECQREETLCALIPDHVSWQAARGRDVARPCPAGPR
jgi:WD40 repeat protein